MGIIVLWFIEHNLIFFAFLIFLAIFIWLSKFQKKLNLNGKTLFLIALSHVVIGFSCMKLMAIIEVGGDLEKAANMRLYGAFFILPILYYIFAKKTNRNVALMMDAMAISAPIGAMSGRFNCLVEGCCQGIPLYGEFRWPIREAELVFYVIFMFYYGKKILYGKTNGEVYPIFLISYGVLRFLCEIVREEYTGQIGPLHLAHIWSLISIAAGILTYILVRKNQKNGRKALKNRNPNLKKREEKKND